MHTGLADRSFFAAPGEWTMWRCLKCGSGYLDPRPTQESLHRAYDVYYTHGEGDDDEVPTSLRGRLRYLLGNDYRNARYGAGLAFAIPLLGRFAARLMPGHRAHIVCEFRFLPKASTEPRLLDVGSGSGGFLRKARDSGWNACGVEPDTSARALSDKYGFDVRPSLDDWKSDAGTFDHVTASHVIEHVHEPDRLLRQIRSMLKPDGTLFIQTPNIDAPTHLRFGANWRGLEPPRHLTVFSRAGLEQLLQISGFRSAKWISDRTVLNFLVDQSSRIAEGKDPYTGVQKTSPPTFSGHRLSMPPSHSQDEFLTVVAEAQ
jgi:SAM-dependent methyltransferase